QVAHHFVMRAAAVVALLNPSSVRGSFRRAFTGKTGHPRAAYFAADSAAVISRCPLASGTAAAAGPRAARGGMHRHELLARALLPIPRPRPPPLPPRDGPPQGRRSP